MDEIVVAADERREGLPLAELLECKLHGLDVVELLSFFEREQGKLPLDILRPDWLIYSDGFERGTLRDVTKRLFDILASVAILGITWPFMLLAVLAIKLEDGPRAPVLYRQVRTGFLGAPFDVLKFRSMTVDAEKEGVAQWATKNDARVTRVGELIRKTRIDELPQILNVLRGDMSFVGPRPERPQFVEQLVESIPYYRERHAVKPGITGWAQVCLPVRGIAERLDPEAGVRPVLHQEPHDLSRHADPLPDRRGGAVREGGALSGRGPAAQRKTSSIS